jgi:hypothetical protein
MSNGVMEPAEQETVRTFRRQAQDVRRALTALDERPAGRRMVDGYIEIERWLERYRRLCVPVRRTFLDHDKASFRQSSAILRRHADPDLRAAAERANRAYEEILTELGRETVLGGRRIKGAEMVKAWLDAAVFYDSTDRRKQYDEMLATLGKAVEGLAAEYTEDLGRAVIGLDEVAAAALGEPLLPPDPEPPNPEPAKRHHPVCGRPGATLSALP